MRPLTVLGLLLILLCACAPKEDISAAAATPLQTVFAEKSCVSAPATPTPLADAPWLIPVDATPSPANTPAPTPTPASATQPALPDIPLEQQGWSISDGVLTISEEKGFVYWKTACQNKANPISVREPTSLVVLDGVKRIPERAMYGLNSLETVTLPDGLLEVGEGAFSYCENLISCRLPDTIVDLGRATFLNCRRLQNVVLPESLTYLSSSMFCNCRSLTGTLRVPKDVKMLDDHPFASCKLQRIVFEGTVESISAFYLRKTPAIRQLVFLEAPPVQYGSELQVSDENGMVGDSRFGLVAGGDPPTVYYLKKNVGAWAPNGETEWNGFPIVGIDSMDDLPPLGKADYLVGNGWAYEDGILTVIDDGGWQDMMGARFPSDRNPHSDYFTAYRSSIHTVMIGKGVTEPFALLAPFRYGYGDAPETVCIEEGNPCFANENGWVVNKNTQTLICAEHPRRSQETAVVIDDLPEDIRCIGAYAFAEHGNLKSITISETVMTMEESAFSSCYRLTHINLPKTLQRIGSNALSGCISLKTVVISSGDVVIGADGLGYSHSLTSLVFLMNPPRLSAGILFQEEDVAFWSGVYGTPCSLTIYYMNPYRDAWAPNGETEWNGFPIVGIDSMDELPPLE